MHAPRRTQTHTTHVRALGPSIVHRSPAASLTSPPFAHSLAGSSLRAFVGNRLHCGWNSLVGEVPPATGGKPPATLELDTASPCAQSSDPNTSPNLSLRSGPAPSLSPALPSLSLEACSQPALNFSISGQHRMEEQQYNKSRRGGATTEPAPSQLNVRLASCGGKPPAGFADPAGVGAGAGVGVGVGAGMKCLKLGCPQWLQTK